MKAGYGSKEICADAVKIALTEDIDAESALKQELRGKGVLSAAVNFGIIDGTHAEEGAVAGAAKEAVSQIANKALGLNVGGKIGIARCGEHICVCVYFGIGLLHLNEMAIALGHRAI